MLIVGEKVILINKLFNSSSSFLYGREGIVVKLPSIDEIRYTILVDDIGLCLIHKNQITSIKMKSFL